ncbi:MAG: hypothetical protein P8Y71_27545 [Pseudolabrys sp.]
MIMDYRSTNTTLGEKIVAGVGFLLLSTVVAAVMVASHLAGIA